MTRLGGTPEYIGKFPMTPNQYTVFPGTAEHHYFAVCSEKFKSISQPSCGIT